MFTERTWAILKWCGVTLFLSSTMIMLNPHVAASAITPWVMFIIGNVIWMCSAYRKDWAMFSLCLSYLLWDIMIATSRHYPHFFDPIQPIINLLEVLP